MCETALPTELQTGRSQPDGDRTRDHVVPHGIRHESRCLERADNRRQDVLLSYSAEAEPGVEPGTFRVLPRTLYHVVRACIRHAHENSKNKGSPTKVGETHFTDVVSPAFGEGLGVG